MASDGSSTLTTWKRRVSAGSFSMCCLYSAQVVAAIVRNSPRARAGFRRLAASPVPAAPPAPISVCASSMNRMIGTSDDCTSSITAFRRFSNSPLTLAPACIRPMSSARTLMFFIAGGTSPCAMRIAKPSTTAVLPTPASPVRIGLFCRRRIRMSMIWRISGSRPTTGSILPSRARCVRSVAYFASAESPPGPRFGASGAVSSVAVLPSSEPSSTASIRAITPSASILSNSGLILDSSPSSAGVLRQASRMCPLRTVSVPNSSVARFHASWMAWNMWSENSSIEVAPRGSLSSARVRSAAMRLPSMPASASIICTSERSESTSCWMKWTSST